MLRPCERHVMLYLVQPRKRADMTGNFLTGM